VTLVIGVGDPWRGDDGAGPAVARRLHGVAEVVEQRADALALVQALAGADHVVLVDAAASGAAPGTIRRFDAARAPLPVAAVRSPSTHAGGVADAIELARGLGRLPARLEVYAIEGREFAHGTPLSPPVADAVRRVADLIAADVRRAPRLSPRASPPAA